MVSTRVQHSSGWLLKAILAVGNSQKPTCLPVVLRWTVRRGGPLSRPLVFIAPTLSLGEGILTCLQLIDLEVFIATLALTTTKRVASVEGRCQRFCEGAKEVSQGCFGACPKARSLPCLPKSPGSEPRRLWLCCSPGSPELGVEVEVCWLAFALAEAAARRCSAGHT